MNRSLRERFDELPRPIVIAIAVFLVLAISVARHRVAAEFRISFLYLIPISLAAWFVGRRAGVLIAILSALGWLSFALAAGTVFSRDSMAYGNGILLLIVNLVFGIVLSQLREALAREKRVCEGRSINGYAEPQGAAGVRGS